MILHKPHDTKLDIWCIGVLIYELLVGKAPFYSKKHSETIELIKRVQYNIPNSICGSSHHLIARVNKIFYLIKLKALNSLNFCKF